MEVPRQLYPESYVHQVLVAVLAAQHGALCRIAPYVGRACDAAHAHYLVWWSASIDSCPDKLSQSRVVRVQ